MQLKARGRVTLNSMGNELSAFLLSIVESQATSKTFSSFTLAVVFEGVFQASFGRKKILR